MTQNVRIGMSDNYKHIALIPLVFLSGDELHRWRIENEDIIEQCRHLIEVYKLTIKDDKLNNKMFEHLIDSLNKLNLKTINII